MRGVCAASTMRRDKPGLKRLRFTHGSTADGFTPAFPGRALVSGPAAGHRPGDPGRAGTAAPPEGPRVHAAVCAEQRHCCGEYRRTDSLAALGLVADCLRPRALRLSLRPPRPDWRLAALSRLRRRDTRPARRRRSMAEHGRRELVGSLPRPARADLPASVVAAAAIAPAAVLPAQRSPPPSFRAAVVDRARTAQRRCHLPVTGARRAAAAPTERSRHRPLRRRSLAEHP